MNFFQKLNIFKSITNPFKNQNLFSIPVNNVKEFNKKIVIIGAGAAGLACSIELIQNGETDFIVIEASDGPGGRIKTDKVNGFLLDRY